MTKWQLIDSLFNKTLITVQHGDKKATGYVMSIQRENGGAHGWNLKMYSPTVDSQFSAYVRTTD